MFRSGQGDFQFVSSFSERKMFFCYLPGCANSQKQAHKRYALVGSLAKSWFKFAKEPRRTSQSTNATEQAETKTKHQVAVRSCRFSVHGKKGEVKKPKGQKDRAHSDRHIRLPVEL
jgi:hypothetical protein